MNEILKNGLKLFGRTVLINILCFFVVLSIISFSVAVFAEPVGYVAYGTKKDAEQGEELYTHYLADGEDKKEAEFTAKGYTISKSNIKEMDKTSNAICLTVAQFFALGILLSFVYPNLWDIGNKDNNMVRIGKRKEDRLKGLKIGFIGAVPSMLLLLFLAVTKSGVSAKFPTAFYKMLNASFYPVMESIMKPASTFEELGVFKLILMALPLFVVPLVAHLGYYLGYKDISISEKFTYKSKAKQRR